MEEQQQGCKGADGAHPSGGRPQAGRADSERGHSREGESAQRDRDQRDSDLPTDLVPEAESVEDPRAVQFEGPRRTACCLRGTRRKESGVDHRVSD